jgi:molecular chaperone GrpE
MMKKKTHDQEDNKRKKDHETTDNKENTNNNNNNGQPGSEQPSSDNKAPADSPSDKNVDAVRAVEEKLAEMQDKYIRLSAEFDNYRKRTLREKIDLSKYAEENVLLKIIPLMDDFERALLHIDSAENMIPVKNGIELIYNKFSEFLRQSGIREIESLNSNFNVDLHEAVAKVPVEENGKKGKVVDVVLKGYYLHDKILRFAKVVVGE